MGASVEDGPTRVVVASEAAQQMVDALLLYRSFGPERVELAARGALAAGAHDGRAIAVLGLPRQCACGHPKQRDNALKCRRRVMVRRRDKTNRSRGCGRS
jgi:hypothetical protein